MPALGLSDRGTTTQSWGVGATEYKLLKLFFTIYPLI